MSSIAGTTEHRAALAGFTAVVRQVPADAWHAPTPCTEWDAAALVEHVIGFHQFLLLAPLGVRAHRPRAGPLARWLATERAIRSVLDDPDALARPASYFDGATRPPAEMLPALADDTLVHTWDLARAVGLPDRLDGDACDRAYANARHGGRRTGLAPTSTRRRSPCPTTRPSKSACSGCWAATRRQAPPIVERRTGIEPASSPWKGEALPLSYRRARASQCPHAGRGGGI